MDSSKGAVSMKRISFHEKERLQIKEMTSTKRNKFHPKELLPLKAMTSNRKISFILKGWFLLMGIAFTKGHGFHSKK